MSVISNAENSFKMAQALAYKKNYDQSISLCNTILKDIKPLVLANDLASIQLLSVTIGLLSELYENKNEPQMALSYKTLQRNCLEYLIDAENHSFDQSDNNSNILTPKQLINSLDDIQNAKVTLSSNPNEAMQQIMQALERSKTQKINEAINSLSKTKNNPTQNPKLTLSEKFIQFFFSHPIIIAFLIVLFMIFLIFFIISHIHSDFEIPESHQKRLHDLSKYLNQMNL